MSNEILDENLNNTIEKPVLNFAGFWVRFGAYLIDLIPIIIIINILIYVFFGLSPFDTSGRVIDLDGQEFGETEVVKALVRYLSFFVWIVYCAIAESSSWQGTLGKKMLGIKVSDEYGNRISFGKSILRNLSKILSYLILAIGFIWAGFDKKKRGWHDFIAKTYVIRNSY